MSNLFLLNFGENISPTWWKEVYPICLSKAEGTEVNAKNQPGS